jgi:conjugative relaxase-like TrwC/TraI family protein
MQTTHKIAGSSADAYAAYLTSMSDRGDYYTTGSRGEDQPDAPVGAGSRWHGSQAMLADLGLSSDEPVQRDELRALMRGVSPRDGGELRPVGGNGSRVAGVDLTFSAPKSVSALWAVSSPYERAQIEAAHARAVAGTIARIEREVDLVRTRFGGELRFGRAERLLAAEFVHTSSRLTRNQESGGVPDPQLHSHVVVLGAQRGDGRFAAVESRELFRSARANGAWYRAELAHGLQRLGLEVQGRTGRGERYFELSGVPAALAERWSARASDIERAARAFRTHYGRDPRAGELGALTVNTRGTKAMTAEVDVDGAWRAVGEEYGLSRERVRELFDAQRLLEFPLEERDLAGDLLADVTRERAIVSERDLRARAYELSAGVCRPSHADAVIADLARSGELVALHGGAWTTRELRDRELGVLAIAGSRANERAAPVGESALREARRELERDLGASLSAEQRAALATITGTGGVTALVGQAGTGKGVVVSAAAGAWRREGYEVIGTAVAGATAKRLGADAKLETSLTADALVSRAQSGRMTLDARTVVVMDEAGMADTSRLAALTELTARHRSKLVLVGDQAQLPSIGAGGMFAALQDAAPTAQVSEVRRARRTWEREAWRQVREGASERALASYTAHGRLHIADTREQALDRMVGDWDRARRERPEQRTVMLTDASNAELDRVNARAQELRARAGELGAHQAKLPERPYGLAAGDEVIFTAALYPPRQERVENGTLGTVLDTDGDSQLTIRTHGAQKREVSVHTREFAELRLSYAQHVYKAQGRTVDQAFVLTGGWQTDRERAYVALTRAQDRTDVYVCREDLGEQGMDAGTIERLGEAMAESHAQEASIVRLEQGASDRQQRDRARTHEAPAEQAEHSRDRDSEAAEILREPERERNRDYALGWEIE